MNILDALGILLGSILVVFIPGFVWTFVLFDVDEIDVIERIALSFGLSIALVSLIIFYLNYLMGIGISVLTTSATVIGLIATGSAFLAIKKRRRAEKDL